MTTTPEPLPRPPVLEVRGLSKTFGALKILDGLDLVLHAGEHALVIGPSGSGKSTLLHVIARLVEPDTGSLRFEGRPYASLGDSPRFRIEHVGFVFQEFHLVESLTVAQNVEILQLAAPSGRPELSMHELLSPLGLEARAHTPVRVLSRGERQRVAMARAFANAPTLVLADEPTSSLDVSSRGRTLDHLFHLCDRCGATAVIVAHDPEVAQRTELAHVLGLRGGRLEEISRDSVAPGGDSI